MNALTDIDWSSWKAQDPATLVYVVKEDSMLLMRKKRGLGAGKINAPGGRVEPGESLIECAVRETQEELLVTPHDLELIGDNKFQFVDGYSLHAHVFRASEITGVPTETEEAIPHWFRVTEIPYHEMWEDDVLWVPHILSRTRFTARYIFDGDKMLDHQIDLI